MNDLKKDGPSILSRVVVTLALLLISVATLYLGRLEIDKQLVIGVVTGLIVLATAGLWVSFFAEREAQRTGQATAEGIRQATDLSRACVEVGLLQIFPSSDEEEYHHFVGDRLLRAHRRSEIRVAGIACRAFFHADGGPNNPQIKQLAAREVPMRVILLHPFFEPAITRAIREDSNRTHFSEHPHSMLVSDIIRSCEGIVGLHAKSIEARLCPVAVTCRLTFVSDILMFEPHHFGSHKERASIATPVFIVKSDVEFAHRLANHFEFLWEISKPFIVSSDLIGELRSRNVQGDAQSYLGYYMQACRPDLFVPEEKTSPQQPA